MILKHADGRDDDIKALRRLSDLASTAAVRKKIAKQIADINIGEKGEKATAFHLAADFSSSRDHVVLHDLVIRMDDAYAKMDHLVITRRRQVFVLETKAIRGTLRLDDDGICTAIYGSRSFRMESPADQVRRHASVLRAWLEETGSSMREVIPVVAVSKDTVVEGRSEIPFISCDRLPGWIRRHEGGGASRLVVGKDGEASTEEIIGAGWLMAQAHSPRAVDWASYHGIDTTAPAQQLILIESEAVNAPASSAKVEQRRMEEEDTAATRNAKISEVHIHLGVVKTFEREDGSVSIQWKQGDGRQRFNDACRAAGGRVNAARHFWTLPRERAAEVLDMLSRPERPKEPTFEAIDITFDPIQPVRSVHEEEESGGRDHTLHVGERRQEIMTPFGPVGAVIMANGNRMLTHAQNESLKDHLRATCHGRAKWNDALSFWIVPAQHYEEIARRISMET